MSYVTSLTDPLVMKSDSVIHWWAYGNAGDTLNTSCGETVPDRQTTVYPNHSNVRVTCSTCLAELARQHGCAPDELYNA